MTELEKAIKFDWLKQRKNSIGGSEAAAIVGLNPYRSALSVWQDKISDEIIVKEPNEAMRQGTDLEDYVAKRFEEATGKKVEVCDKTITNELYPYAHANIDRLIADEKAILECKTTSQMNLKRFRNGEYPTEYYVQCMHYLAVTGYDKAYLAVLVYSKGFYVFEIERDEEEIKALMATEKDFWENCVMTKTPPTADDYPLTLADVENAYPTSNGESIKLEGRNDLAGKLLTIRADIKALEKKAETIETILKSEMKDCEVAFTDNFKITWKNSVRQVFDYKRYIDDNKTINFSDYYNVSSSRRFSIKVINQA